MCSIVSGARVPPVPLRWYLFINYIQLELKINAEKPPHNQPKPDLKLTHISDVTDPTDDHP